MRGRGGEGVGRVRGYLCREDGRTQATENELDPVRLSLRPHTWWLHSNLIG